MKLKWMVVMWLVLWFDTGEIIQFYGCMFHASPTCYPRELPHPLHKGLTMVEVFDRHVKAATAIKAKHNVLEK